MKRVSVEIQCPGCQGKELVWFKKPGVVTASISTFECKVCGSFVLAKIKLNTRAKAGKANNVSVQVKVTHASPELIAMRAEEAAEREADQKSFSASDRCE